MKRRDGFLGMESQNHLLESRKTRLLCTGRDLGKEVGRAILLILKTYLKKGRIHGHLVLVLLQGLLFQFHHLKDLSRCFYFNLVDNHSYIVSLTAKYKAIMKMWRIEHNDF